ncbi:Membrane protein involved in the export of O-antigen and teichoic acid [Nakamurella panacisegetis]|uniref:Membrane protein involved in the export of O-antigen and teichoic acid n=1 Tax=Nakamurella panacisegetis TaxID=1090615 RepID=A0A1H0M0E7_9ACTN|nr:hypothetical protein [Nakamurella panacisegetis]SDO73676.1 Membrane protein involved in the export of O-antigen and teichoic acid [Nakamurella panacisegetis]
MSAVIDVQPGSTHEHEQARSGMLGDGLALGASALLTAGAGMVGWLLAARLLTASEVGATSSFVNSFILVAAIAELGLGPALLRWLPLSGGRTADLLKRVYLLVSVVAVAVGVGWLVLAGGSVTAAVPVVGGLLFVLASLGWTLFQLQDLVLTGVGAARWVPLENLLFSAARIVLLLLLGPSLGAKGLVLSWVIPTLVGVVVVNLALVVKGRSRPATDGVLPTRREVVKLVGPTYPATVFLAVLYNVVPLVVSARYGSALGAVFFIVWTGLNALDLAATGFVNAMVIRLARFSSDSRRLIRESILRSLAIFLPLLAVGFLLSHWVLGWFGPTYAAVGTDLLRVILIAFPARLMVVLVTGAHLAAGRGTVVALLQGLNAAGMMAVISLMPTPDLVWIGYGFLAIQAVIAAAGLLDLRRRSVLAGPGLDAAAVGSELSMINVQAHQEEVFTISVPPAAVSSAVEVLSGTGIRPAQPESTPPTGRSRHARPAAAGATSDVRAWLPILLAAAAVVMWFCGLRAVGPQQLHGLGLIAVLSPLTIAAYPVLVASAVLELFAGRRRTWVLTLMTLAALLLIYGLQPMIEQAARLPVGWLHAGFANYIGANGQILSNFDTRFSWPGFFAVAAFIGRAAGISDVSVMLAWAPVVLTGLATLGMRSIATAVFGHRRIAWVATWLFLLGNWSEQDYFSPQGTAFILLIGALAVTLKYLVRPGIISGGRVRLRDRVVPENSPRTRLFAQAVVVLLATALAPTHQLTPFVLIGMLALLVLWGRLYSTWLPIFAALPALAWFALGAKQFWVGQLSLITSSIGDVNGSVTQGIGQRLDGDSGHQLMVYLRIGLTCLLAVLALIGFIVLRRRGVRTWVLPVLGVSSFGLAVLQPYGGEVFMRCFLFALPWFAIGAAIALDALAGTARAKGRVRRLTAVGVVLAGIMLSTVSARGGNDAYVSVTTADVNAIHYVYAHAAAGDSVISALWYEPLRSDRVGDLTQISTDELATAANPCTTEAQITACLVAAAPNYILINPQQEAAGEILNGLAPGWSGRVLTALETKSGYRVAFEQDDAIVLQRKATG